MPTDQPTAPENRPTGPSGEPTPSRRGFLRLALAAGGLGLTGLGLSGCANTQTTSLPGPEWPESSDPWLAGTARSRPPLRTSTPVASGGFMPRSAWTNAAPRPSKMNPMLPVRYVTVHHSAGPLFETTDRAATADRLERIRRFHCEERGWGDIGYHYAIDRAGRVWSCRPMAWQGAHVKHHNEYNIGVMLLGDFDQQQPTDAQLAALTSHVGGLMRDNRVSPSRLMTHQEWASTACPGSSIQRYMVSARASGRFG